MVYLTAAAKQNRLLLEHIQGHALYRRFNEVEREQFDDAMIEAHQLVSMTDLISQVLQQLSASYNNILNNNLNDSLTILTSYLSIASSPCCYYRFLRNECSSTIYRRAQCLDLYLNSKLDFMGSLISMAEENY